MFVYDSRVYIKDKQTLLHIGNEQKKNQLIRILLHTVHNINIFEQKRYIPNVKYNVLGYGKLLYVCRKLHVMDDGFELGLHLNLVSDDRISVTQCDTLYMNIVIYTLSLYI